MRKIAIDVAILPPGRVINRAISVNRELGRHNNSHKIILNKRRCLPHVTLAMGCIREGDLPLARGILKDIAGKKNRMALVIQDLYSHTIASGETVSGFAIRKSRQLQSFHEEVMTRLKPLLSYDPIRGMFAFPSEIDPITMKLVQAYPKAAYARYFPHITLGLGRGKPLAAQIRFNASRIAICQLGNYCTCRKILAEFVLQRIP